MNLVGKGGNLREHVNVFEIEFLGEIFINT